MFNRLFAGALFASLMMLGLSACDADKLGKLKPGITPANEVRKLMGPPNIEWKNEDGSRVWEYPRMPEGLVNYMLLIGPDDILREVRQVLTADNFSRVKPGMSREEVHRLLGRPAHQRYFALKQETVWDWKTKVESGMEWFFNVHFNEDGVVTRTETSSVPKG
jgi:outer membrane protein assembly factor BamE (lipoprotein component of BamABCDE complex)